LQRTVLNPEQTAKGLRNVHQDQHTGGATAINVAQERTVFHMPKEEVSNLVTPPLLTPRIRAIFDKAAELANEKSKAELGESIYARGLRDWARSKGLDAPPDRWPCGFTRIADDPLSWQPFDWNGRRIGGEPWRFERPPDDVEPGLNLWGDVLDNDGIVGFELSEELDPGAWWRKEYFYTMGEVLDETVDPIRYTAVLMRLPRGPTDDGASLAA
jgi:hypothetical protein